MKAFPRVDAYEIDDERWVPPPLPNLEKDKKDEG